MSGALISLNAWGWAFVDAVIAVGAAMMLIVLVCAVTCVFDGRRYVRTGIRDLERYLGQPLAGAAPPRRPGHGEAGQHRDGGGNR
jgi:hypothetical protein